jgi:probable rRNA maturation factor
MPARPDPRLRKSSRSALLRISITAHCGLAHASFIRRNLKIAHQILRPPLADLSVVLVGDRQMSDLHFRFMAIAGPTDVLTFPLDFSANGHPISGEVVICVPEDRRRAREHATPLSHELLLYAIHGMLHLCGHDDRTAREFKIMHRTEDDLLTRLGVGPVFAASPAKSASPRRRKVR